MKKADKVYREFVVIAKYLLKELDYYGVNQFKQKPAETEWSIGQIYDHLISGTLNFHLREIKNCLDRNSGSIKGSKTFRGNMFFMMGKYPPVKFKGMSKSNYEPAQPTNTIQVKDDLYKFIKIMNQTAREIDNANLDYKTINPSLGMLNALEWYKLIGMHFKHHLRQKHKLDKQVRSYTKEGIAAAASQSTVEVDDDFDLLY